MAETPGIRVDGARQLRRSMRRAGLDLEDLKATHARIAGMVATTGKSYAPRRSGRLAASIRPSGTKTAAIVRAGYARVPYAHPIHWGWPRRGIRANPWLSRAAQSSEPAWLAIYTREVDRILGTIEGAAHE
jgi:hypothetical protein